MESVSSSCNRAKRASRWPLQSDFKIVSRKHAKALVSEFGAIFGLDVLRTHGNFTHMTFSTVGNFDNVDLVTAIQFMIDHLACDTDASGDEERKFHLIKRLEAACGPLNQPIALAVDCSKRTFGPART